MQVDRTLAKLAANAGGFFWLPCPSCGQEFGGHEWTPVNGHESSIPREVKRDADGNITSISSSGICPACTAKGVGCRAHHESYGGFHDDCEFVPPLAEEAR